MLHRTKYQIIIYRVFHLLIYVLFPENCPVQVARPSENLLSDDTTTRRHNPEDHDVRN